MHAICQIFLTKMFDSQKKKKKKKELRFSSSNQFDFVLLNIRLVQKWVPQHLISYI